MSILGDVVSSGTLKQRLFWIGLACLVFAYFLISRLATWYRLQHIRGPWHAGWSSFWLFSKTWKGHLYQDLPEVCNKYGPLVRIAPNFVVCSDPFEIRRLWAPRSQFDRSRWWKGFRLDPPRDCSLSMCIGDPHSAMRAKIAPGYSGKDVDGVHESIDEGIAHFIRFLEDKYVSTDTDYRPVDIGRKIQYLTLDLISDIAFRERFGFMDHDGDLYDYIKITEKLMPALQIFALLPWLLDLLHSPFGKLFLSSDQDSVGMGPIVKLARRVVAERYGPNKVDNRDMLGSFVRNGLSQPEAESESLLQIFAGSDTTATAARNTLLEIVTSPEIYKRLQNEIDTGIAEGRISSPITDAEGRNLPLLQACFKEAMRLWPPISGLMPRVSNTDGVVCGVRIPAGTHVCWSARSVLRSKEVFGVDAEMFRPDRWLLADAERRKVMQNTVDLCFGEGRWVCLGRAIACVELNKILVEILRRFDLTILSAEKPVRSQYYGVILQSGMNMRITRRKTSVKGAGH